MITARSYGQSLRPTTDRTINQRVVLLIVRSIEAFCDRSYDQSWDTAPDHTISPGILRPIACPIMVLATDRIIGRTTNCILVRQILTRRE